MGMEDYFKIPIAVLKNTDCVVNVKDVPNGSGCNCYCPICKGDLIAVNREIKQKAHFRHASSNNCNLKGESYIHWLTKEVFKQINTFNTPPISTWHLYEGSDIHKDFLNDLNDYFKNYNVTNLLPPPIVFINPKCVLQTQSELLIENCQSEVQYNTPFGVAQIDIVASISGKPFFIEPFFTNKIQEDKLRKLIFLDTSVLSIDLTSFILRKGWVFTIEEFKHFLTTETEAKEWIYVRNSKMKRLLDNYLLKMHDKLKGIKLLHQENLKVESKIVEVAKKMALLQKEKIKLHDEIKKIDITHIFE